MTVRGRGRWALIHRCTDCGRLRLNRTAGDDNLLLLMRLAALPLTVPPNPFEDLGSGQPDLSQRRRTGSPDRR